MKKWLVLSLISCIIALVASVKLVSYTNKKLEIAMNNIKAYDNQLAKSNEQTKALKLTVGQLNHYKDSILRVLNDTRKKLKIKDSQVVTLQYVESSFTKTDSVFFRDTIFRESMTSIDTIFGDEWYQARLRMEYPDKMYLEPRMKSEKHIIVYTKKETINPPKKFFLFRWFQKKQKVLNISIIEKNPYIENKNNRYVEIIK